MKRIYLVLIVIIAIVASGFLYVYYKAANTKPQPLKSSTKNVAEKKPIINFEPLLISKLQQLVKDGSHGLYNLSLDGLKINLLTSSVVITNAVLTPDAKALKVLDSTQKAPDDVFKISLHSLTINGIDVKDLLFKKTIDLKVLTINHPMIEVYHQLRPYNQDKRQDSLTLYQRLTQQMNRIAIKNIVVAHGTLVHHTLAQKNKITRFNDVSMHFTDLLIDSTTQFDKERFLFSKDAIFSFHNYVLKTPDSLYLFKMGAISVSAVKHSIVATQVALEPRDSKQQFEKKVKFMKERYILQLPKITFNNINWWDVANEESFTAAQADIYDGTFNVYLDRSLPLGPSVIRTYPHQLLMKLPLPINIAKLNVHNLNIVYEELDPGVGKSGKIYVDHVNAAITNITNLPAAIKKNHQITIAASGRFLHQYPITTTFRLDLSHYKTGKFSADVHTGGLEGTQLNSVAEPLGLFLVKSGTVKELTAHVDGDNKKGTGKVLLLYDDLHIMPLKKGESQTGDLKKRKLIGLFANLFVIKNANPAKGDAPRKPDCEYIRQPGASFFNLIWKTTLVGILKTVGAPTKLAY